MHCVDLGESFPTSIYLQNLASIQPRTSPNKFVSSSSREFELKLCNFEPLICSPDNLLGRLRRDSCRPLLRKPLRGWRHRRQLRSALQPGLRGVQPRHVARERRPSLRIEMIKLIKSPPDLERLTLDCIEADFCK